MKEINLNMNDLKAKFLKESGINDRSTLLIKGTNYGDYCVLIRNETYDEDGDSTYSWKDIGNDWRYVHFCNSYDENMTEWPDKTTAIMAALENDKTIHQFDDTFEMCEFIANEKIVRKR